eukprot:g28359.t2
MLSSIVRRLPVQAEVRPAVRFHCQVPCGIFTDELRVQAMMEDASTIRKSVVQAQELHKAGALQDIHQMVRWIATKEEHAQKIMTTTADYFLAQKVKKADLDPDEYLKRLALHHDVMVAAMKAKQSSELVLFRSVLGGEVVSIMWSYLGKSAIFLGGCCSGAAAATFWRSEERRQQIKSGEYYQLKGAEAEKQSGSYYQVLGHAWDHFRRDFCVVYRPLYHCEAVQVLLNAKALVDAKDENCCTALHRAAQAGNCETLRTLLAAGANVAAEDECRWTPLHYASQLGWLKIADLLLDAKADAAPKNLACSTPLALATIENQVRMVELLLQHGADLNARTKGLLSPLMMARDGRFEAHLLATSHFERFDEFKKVSFDEMDLAAQSCALPGPFFHDQYWGLPPRTAPVSSAQEAKDVQKSVLADLTSTKTPTTSGYGTRSHQDAIRTLCFDKLVEALRLLKRAEPDDINIKDSEGLSFLDHAAIAGMRLLCTALLWDADFEHHESTSASNFTSLHWAASCGQAGVCHALLEHPRFLDIATLDACGRTALHLSSAKNAPWPQMLELVRGIEKAYLEPGLATQNVLIGTLGSQSQLQLALKLLKELPDHTYRSDVITFTQAVKACTAALTPNQVTCSSCISACEKSERWPWAVKLLDTMRQAALRLGLEACNAAMSACQGSGWPQALALLSTMRELGPFPDEISYNSAMKASQSCCYSWAAK